MLPDHINIEQKCVAIANMLGLIHWGHYTVIPLTADIVVTGGFPAMNWEGQ